MSRKRCLSDNDGQTDCYGPALPPHLIKSTRSETRNISQDCSPIKEPKIEIIGPELPSHLQKHSSSIDCKKELAEAESSCESCVLVIGPSLPPCLSKNHEDNNSISANFHDVGALLPRNSKKDSVELQISQPSKVLGPTLPPHLVNLNSQIDSDNSEDDDNTFGPLPPEASKLSGAHIALEERALYMKMEQLDPQEKPPAREEWMMELPEVKASQFGLGPRQFRSKEGPDMSDRSSWTKIAGKSKASEPKVQDIQKEAELRELKRRDKEQEKMAKKHKKKDQSLLESHQEKLKEKKQEGPTERRPFSRDIDLQVNRFDEAQKKAVLKKAQLLDDRFSSGNTKYL